MAINPEPEVWLKALITAVAPLWYMPDAFEIRPQLDPIAIALTVVLPVLFARLIDGAPVTVLLPIVKAEPVNDIVGAVVTLPVIPYCDTVIWTLPPTLADVVAKNVAVLTWPVILIAAALTNVALTVPVVVKLAALTNPVA